MYFHSSSWSTDGAQTTVPFFDFQDVAFHPSSPLAGVGLYYKGTPNYGGFVGLKAMAPDYSDAIKPENIRKSFDELLETAKQAVPKNLSQRYDD